MATNHLLEKICNICPSYKQNSNLIEQYANLSSGDKDVYTFSHETTKVNRTAILNHLTTTYDYQDYLEIGVRDGSNLQQIIAKNKTGVDPTPLVPCDYEETSDQFFSVLPTKKHYDLIFIDGLHLAEQVYKDIRNALKHLRNNGTIVLHDCNPPSSFHQRENYLVDSRQPAWNGTVWKAWAQLRCDSPHLDMSVVNTDWGVGIIQKGKQTCYEEYNEYIYSYDYLEKHRKELLNLISTDDFLNKYQP
jgi:hypothetical protein